MRVLYVEDNRINAILFEEMVRMHGGMELQIAEDGAEALEIVADWEPELLVLDAHLPDMTGFELLARLRELESLTRVPAIMCSADAGADDRKRAADAGFVGYWAKPIDVTAVRADLSRMLASR